MNRAELIQTMSERMGLSNKYAGIAVDALITVITDSLRRGESVQFPGFGTFSVRKKAATTARNPKTGATVDVPAKKVPVFKSGSKLKAAVDSSSIVREQ